MKKRTKIILIILAALLLFGSLSLVYLRKSRSAAAVSFRSWAKQVLVKVGMPRKDSALRDAEKLLPEGWELVEDDVIGFALGLPADAVRVDYIVPGVAVFEGEGFRVSVSREWSVEADVAQYVGYYFNRFVLDEDYRRANGLTLLGHASGPEYDRIELRIDTDAVSGNRVELDTYIYANFFTSTQSFYRVMMKYDSTSAVAAHMPSTVTDTFYSYRGQEIGESDKHFAPVANPNWNDETHSLYERISNTDDVMWGIFTQHVESEGIDVTIPAMEEKLGAKFDVILNYEPITYDGYSVLFPTEFMEKAHADGKVIELTYQLTHNNNENLFEASPSLELYKAGDNETIRRFARAAAEFGHPFLFRLNNEMNSDWTNYSGVVNLQDPDIYVETWRTIFNIFEEEGAHNAIWIWNPHDRSYPPAEWTHYLAYYPGDEYVHMLGITGYNNGDYYAQRYNEYWREFDEIYGLIIEELGGRFDAFPWIITEFGSSSFGGDKAKWIDGMFDAIGKYERIKVAVWFSYADFDDDGTIARPYWLDETEETLEAFRRGLQADRD